MLPGSNVPSELLTPTGAALLTTLGSQSLAAPGGTVTKTGYGCGTREFDNHPNFLRATLIERQGTAAPLFGEAIDVLETDMDHLTGELMGNVGTLLMEQGALDVSWTPIFMKKNRPGYRLTVIAKPDKSQDLVDSIIYNTHTLGVRVQHMHRVVAEREEQKGTFAASSVNEKLCSYKNHIWVKIENDDLAMVAKADGIPVIEAAERYLKEKGKEEGKINR